MRISDWSSDVCSSDLLRRIVAACGHDPSQVAHIEARFTAPVFPGETIHTEIWRDDRTVSFRARLVARDVVALDHGKIRSEERRVGKEWFSTGRYRCAPSD